MTYNGYLLLIALGVILKLAFWGLVVAVIIKYLAN